MRAWGVVPAANNAVADAEAGQLLAARGLLHVPDVVASAGAVIEGIGRTVMGLDADERARLIDRLGDLAGEILAQSAAAARPADQIAEALARDRLGKNV